MHWRSRVRVSLVVTGVFLCAPHARAEGAPAGATAAGVQRQAARQHYEQGLAHAAHGDYALALDEFRQAYAKSPNYAVLYNIGQAELALGRPLAAVFALSSYLRDGGSEVPSERAQQVKKQIAELSALFAEISVASELGGAVVSVDERDVGLAPLAEPVRVQAGTHVVTASRDGAVLATEVITVGEGEKTRVHLAAAPPPAAPLVPPASTVAEAPPSLPAPVRRPVSSPPAGRHGPSVPLGYVVAGAGVALAGGTLAHYFWNRGRHGQWLANEELLGSPATPDRPDLQRKNNNLADSIDRASVVTVVLAASSAALVLAGVAIEVGGAFGAPTGAHTASVSYRGTW